MISDQKADLVGCQYPTEYFTGDVGVARDARRDIADHLGVEAVDEQDQRAQELLILIWSALIRTFY